jgi:hypothetical protein
MQRKALDKLATAHTAVTALARVLAETKELPFGLQLLQTIYKTLHHMPKTNAHCCWTKIWSNARAPKCENIRFWLSKEMFQKYF